MGLVFLWPSSQLMNHCRLPYGSWGWPEFKAAVCAFGRRQVTCGHDVGRLERQLGFLLNESRVFAVNSGRTALRMGLEGLAKLRPGRLEVIIPAYVCPAVVHAVRSAGLRPVPAEVGRDLNLRLDSARERIGDKTLAIIAIHMYGCPAAIVEFEKLAVGKGIFLVDDAAQVVGESINGRMLGTFGDFGLFSFAQSKCMVTGESGAGGALICRNQALLPILLEQIESLEPSRSRGKAFVSFVWGYLLAAHTRRITYYWQRFKRPASRTIHPAKIANLDAKIALCQLATLMQRRKERMHILNKYAQQLSTIDCGLQLLQYAPDRYLTRAMVLLPAGHDAASCRRLLRMQSIETRLSYPIFAEEAHPADYAREVADRLLELPASSAMGDSDVMLVCDRLKKIIQGRNTF